MADGNNKVAAPEQLGAIAFNADLGTAICEVILTAPYGLQSLKVKVPLIDILESAAEINLTAFKLQRQMLAKMRRDLATGGKA